MIGLASCPKHVLVIAALVLWTLAFGFWTHLLEFRKQSPCINPFAVYGRILTVFLLAIKYTPLLALPKIITTAAGLVAFNTFPGPVKLKGDPKEAPLLCVRVVTRGLYPELVKYTLKWNIGILNTVGIKNFIVEVVTNNAIGLSGEKVREVVLPTSYKTKRGAVNRARNLQYCLDKENNVLGDDAWIVHIDEETLLTEDSAKGIVNFITEGSCDFGQGVISYAGDQQDLGDIWRNFQHHVCTVADGCRVTVDMGQLRGQLKLFQRPIFGWKGPFIVARVKAAMEVSFDHGPECSLAEDNFFAMVAMNTGKYRFGFVEGEMWERSPFTFADYFQQRRRWIQGWMNLVASNKVPWRMKLFCAMSLATWVAMPLTVCNAFIWRLFPIGGHPLADSLVALVGAVFSFHFIFGYIKQFPISSFTWHRRAIILPEIALAAILSTAAESAVAFFAWYDWWNRGSGGKISYYIIQKEKETKDNKDV